MTEIPKELRSFLSTPQKHIKFLQDLKKDLKKHPHKSKRRKKK